MSTGGCNSMVIYGFSWNVKIALPMAPPLEIGSVKFFFKLVAWRNDERHGAESHGVDSLVGQIGNSRQRPSTSANFMCCLGAKPRRLACHSLHASA